MRLGPHQALSQEFFDRLGSRLVADSPLMCNVGGPLARQLHDQGHPVRVLVRDPARAADLPAGIKRAVGNLDNPDDVATALKGVDAVFLMQVGSGTQQTQIMIDAMRDASGTRIVLLSSVSARLMPISDNPIIGGALAAREDLMRESGLDVTYLRPNGFASNALWWLDGIRAGKVVDPTQAARGVCCRQTSRRRRR